MTSKPGSIRNALCRYMTPTSASGRNVAASPPAMLPASGPAPRFRCLDPKESLGEGIARGELRRVDWEPVAKQCGFIREALKTGGKEYSQPLWNLTTLCAVFMTEGHKLAHRMGNKHPDYTPETTGALWQRKVAEHEQRGVGYPSCTAIQAAGCTACASCPHFAAGKSPLNLAKETATQGDKALKKKLPRASLMAGGRMATSAGTPVKGYANTLAAFRSFGVEFTYDTFRHQEFSSGHKITMLDGELSDAAVTLLRDQLRSECGFYPVKDTTREAITAECWRNRVNPVTDYFDRLVWDGTPRLCKFMHKYLGADDTPLNAAIGVKFMCAIVRRGQSDPAANTTIRSCCKPTRGFASRCSVRTLPFSPTFLPTLATSTDQSKSRWRLCKGSRSSSSQSLLASTRSHASGTRLRCPAVSIGHGWPMPTMPRTNRDPRFQSVRQILVATSTTPPASGAIGTSSPLKVRPRGVPGRQEGVNSTRRPSCWNPTRTYGSIPQHSWPLTTGSWQPPRSQMRWLTSLPISAVKCGRPVATSSLEDG